MNKKTSSKSEPNEAFCGFYPVIAPLLMKSGVGDGKTNSCVMAQAATIDALRKGRTLEEPTDEMECACPVLRRLAIRLNDTGWWASDQERTEFLRPLIPLLLDSRGSKDLTEKRAFYCAEQVVTVLTPMRLEWINAHTKSAEVKKQNEAGIDALKRLKITSKAEAKKAASVCSKLRSSAYASADASADAYAYASADAYADASASASADADAYASASADADAYAQKMKYRAAAIQLFRDVAAITS